LKQPGRTRGIAKAILGIALLGAAGCSYRGEARPFDPQDLDQTPGWIAVRTVPVILQQEKTDCGAASLSMVLSHWNIGATLDEVVRQCTLVPERGIRAKDLRDYARSCGLQSYLIHGCWEDLGKEVGLDHPVIVGLVKSDGSNFVTHYEVVVAIHPELKSVVTLDPARGWSLNSMSGFCKEWEPAGFLTLVFFRGDPSQPQPGR
jgi:ABC-type bacteriocin/lantibiotic exporter with double-glycine peptidase domain